MDHTVATHLLWIFLSCVSSSFSLSNVVEKISQNSRLEWWIIDKWFTFRGIFTNSHGPFKKSLSPSSLTIYPKVSFHRLTLSQRSRGARWRIKSQKSNSSKRSSNVAVRLLALPPSHNLPSTVSLAGLLSCRFHNILRSRRFLRYSSLLVVSPPLPGR